MALPLAATLGISGGLSLLNSATNYFSQGRDRNQQNKFNTESAEQQQKWNLENWNRQKNFATEQWNRQNQYNSPIEQMARFKEAGLNPHLIYGKGSASAGTASTISTPDVKPYSRPEAANVTRGLNAFGDYNQFKQIQAQTDNVRQSTELSKQEQMLKAQLTANAAVSGSRQKLDYGVASQLRETQITAAKTNLENLQNNTKKSAADAALATESKDIRVNKIKQEYKNLVAEGNTKALRNKLLIWENQLKKYNLTPQDNAFLRLIQYTLDNKLIKSKK